MTFSGNPTFSKHLQSSKPSGFSITASSSSKSDSSDGEGQALSDSSDSSSTLHKQPERDSSYPEPVFSSIPTRRVQSSNAVFRGMTSCGSPSSYAATAPSSPSPTSATFPRRIPSFPVSRPIRPFDSISNAMGTAPKRVSPPLSRSESLEAHPVHVPGLAAHGDEKLHMKPKGLSVQTVGLETGKPKGRSNILLEPPKNNRFQHGFFILDMTQDEFKTRAW
jgi:hypothetical protein